MTKHTIELTETLSFGKPKLDAFIDVNLSALSTDIVHRLAIHGLRQKIADAAASAKTQDDAIALMQKAADALLAGEWSSRGSGEGVDEWTSVARSIMRGMVKAKLGKDSPEWKAFTGLSDADANAKLDANIEANRAKLASVVDAKIAERKAERERKAALKVDITL